MRRVRLLLDLNQCLRGQLRLEYKEQNSTGGNPMHAADVMTVTVITVTPDTSIHDLATLLSEHGISGVPVVDAGRRLVGIVSEGDLLHRAEVGTDRRTERRRTRWLDLLGGEQDLARDYIKAHGQTVRDVMTREVITVEETTGLDVVADLMETRRIKRVPVVRDGMLVGIISRANLVRALAVTKVPAVSEANLDDRTIRRALLAELQGKGWAKVWAADVTVQEKIVHIWCSDDQSDDERRALRIAAENTDGVRSVEEHLVHVPMTPPI
jgi:CBS domain-containing protein